AGEHTQRAEMMLADPRRVEADLFSINRLVHDVGDKPIGGSGVVRVTIVAQREIAEFHAALLAGRRCACPRKRTSELSQVPHRSLQAAINNCAADRPPQHLQRIYSGALPRVEMSQSSRHSIAFASESS